MKTITMIGTLPPIQGISSYCRELVGELEKKVSVDFVTFSRFAPSFIYKGKQNERDETFNPRAWKNVDIRREMTWYNPFSWIRAGLTTKGDVVHIQWWSYLVFPCFFTIAALSRLRGKKIVYTVHNIFSHETNLLDRISSRIMFMFGNIFIVHSTINKNQLHEKYGISSEKIRVIPHGILSFYSDAPVTKKHARKKINMNANDKIALFFGNVRPYKGIEDLIQAHLLAQKKVSDLKLMIVGGPWTPAYGKIIREIVKDTKGIFLELTFVPSSEVKYYFEAADVVILPYRDFSSQSGVGNIALAFGKPLLVSDAGALSDLVVDEGAVFPAGDVKDLSRKIISFFSDAEWRKKLKEDSLTKAKTFGWPAIAEKTVETYDHVS